MSPWFHPRFYQVWRPGDRIKEILDELACKRADRGRRKVVYLETRSSGLAAVIECDAGYTPRAWRRLRKGFCLGYLCRPASERRDVMRYACLLAEEGRMPWEVAGPAGLMPELRRERTIVMHERAEHLRTARDDGWGIDVPEVVLP